jgi:hypothetical protein
VQKLQLLGTRLREFSLRKKRKWSILIDHRGRVRSPDIPHKWDTEEVGILEWDNDFDNNTRTEY